MPARHAAEAVASRTPCGLVLWVYSLHANSAPAAAQPKYSFSCPAKLGAVLVTWLTLQTQHIAAEHWSARCGEGMLLLCAPYIAVLLSGILKISAKLPAHCHVLNRQHSACATVQAACWTITRMLLSP